MTRLKPFLGTIFGELWPVESRAPFVQPFNLVRWFSILSFLLVALSAVAGAMILSRFLTDKLLTREAEVMVEFVNGTLRIDEVDKYFGAWRPGSPTHEIEEFVRHLGSMPGILRANVYSTDRSILWSSDPLLIGKSFPTNKDLDGAFLGEPQITVGVVGQRKKKEDAFFERVGQRFIESYLPVWGGSSGNTRVRAVVEVYRSPQRLFDTIKQGVRLIWLCAAGGGLFSFAVLLLLVSRADSIMRRQRERIVESEKLAVTGEMASTVAHGLRNPLASIRSSAELALVSDPGPEIREHLQEITAHADRLGHWVSQYLSQTEPEGTMKEQCSVAEAISASLQGFATELDRRGIRQRVEIAPDLPSANVGPLILTQLINGLIANAIEAMPDGGEIAIRAEADDGGMIAVKIEDTGPGMSPESMRRAFRPFTTSKSAGLGLGLPLARRILSRHSGDLSLSSREGRGVTATIVLSAAG